MKIPEYYNEYMGSKVYGNILDYFDSPTYNIRMYMVRDTKIFDQVNDDGTAIWPKEIDHKKDVVILAQTGVTGVQVDNLQIEGFMGGTFTTTKVGFSVIEPGAATFLDQIMVAKAYLGMPQSVTTPFVLDIRFQGYEPSGDETDPEGGETAVAAGPYRWLLTLTKLEVSIDGNGSRYELEAYPLSQLGVVNRKYFELPKDVTTRGTKLEDHFRVLQDDLNKFYSQATTESTVKIEISPEYLIETPDTKGVDNLDLIRDSKLISSSDLDTDKMNRIISDVMETVSADEHASKVVDVSKYRGTEPEKQRDSDAITFKKGTSLDQVFATLLCMNKEMFKKITRRTDPFNPKSPIDDKQAYTSWFRVKPETDVGKYNRELKDFELTIKYKPELYRVNNPNAAYDSKETEVSKEAAEARAKQIVEASNFHKHYEYIFTGRNTDILSLDLKYDMGIALLSAPRGGMIGSPTTAAANTLAPKVDVNQDVTTEGQSARVEESQKEKEKEAIKGALDQLTGLVKDAQGEISNGMSKLVNDLINSAAEALNLPADVLQSAVSGGDSAAVSKLLDSANPTNVSSVAGGLSGAIDKPAIPATEPKGLVDFKPQLSGLSYAADLITDVGDSLTAEQLTDLGYITVEEARGAMKQEPAKADAKSKPNPVEAATAVMGDSRNTLFGNYANQMTSDQAFLAMVDLRLRGDPWYLGSGGLTPNKKFSTKERVFLEKDTQNFWLTIRAPQPYDLDITDEDNNTGYWKFGSTSQTFSGLYSMLQVSHSFSGGVYTIDMQAFRSVLGPENIDPKAAAEKNAEAAEKNQQRLENLGVATEARTDNNSDGRIDSADLGQTTQDRLGVPKSNNWGDDEFPDI